jgi:hypothetical protein
MSKLKIGPGGSQRDYVFRREPDTMFPQSQPVQGLERNRSVLWGRRLGCLLEVGREFLQDINKR